MSLSVFISHASEDKDDVARPLAEELRGPSLDVWFDEYELQIGDSLRKSIDAGLTKCDFGVVILSPAFFAKAWPQAELDALFAKEIATRQKVILPVWHAMGVEEIHRHSPLLAGRIGASTDHGISKVAGRIQAAIVARVAKPAKEDAPPARPHKPSARQTYREFVRATIADELGLDPAKIKASSVDGSSIGQTPGIQHEVDLLFTSQNDIAEYVTIVHCDYSEDPEDLTSEEVVMRAAYIRNDARASKALVVSNTGFTAGAERFAANERVALLVIRPKIELAGLTAAANADSLFDEVRMAIARNAGKSHERVVVRKLRDDERDRSENLLDSLFQDPDLAASAHRALAHPGVRRAAEDFIKSNPGISRDILSSLGKKRF